MQKALVETLQSREGKYRHSETQHRGAQDRAAERGSLDREPAVQVRGEHGERMLFYARVHLSLHVALRLLPV